MVMWYANKNSIILIDGPMFRDRSNIKWNSTKHDRTRIENIPKS